MRFGQLTTRTAAAVSAAAGFFALAGAWTGAALGAALPRVGLEAVSTGELVAPVGILAAGDGTGRLFIVEQRGEVRILTPGAGLVPDPFLDIEDLLVDERANFDERGLLGLSFHPEFGSSGAAGEGKFYVYYSAPSPNAPGTAEAPVDHMSVVAEYSVSAGDPNVADVNSERILFTVDEPQFNHNAGQIAFGPDGMLYVALGDGGSSDDNNAGHTGGTPDKPSGVLGNAQDRTNLLGKILRIDPLGSDGPGGEYGIPADNPFVGEGGGVREEIFAYGLRNPWRFSFDDGPDGTGRLLCADVGQRDIEEINIIESGGNYGWRVREGTFPFDLTTPATGPFVDPIAEYAHPNTDVGLPRIGISVTGGHVYRGAAFPELTGVYIFADWSNGFGQPAGTLLGLREIAPDDFELSVLELSGMNPIPFYIAALGEDENGEIYVAGKTTLAPSALDPVTNEPTGVIFRIIPGADPPSPVTTSIPAAKDNTIFSEGALSNGAGSYLFAGRTNTGNLRRALLQFDVPGAVAAGSTVESASLTLNMNKTIVGDIDVGAHRLLRDWGEAGSDAFGEEGAGAPAQNGDATWTSAFHPGDAWAAQGGDFSPTASASVPVGSFGSFTWASPQMTADVQGFLDDPPSNFGWILVAEENTTSAKRFDSSEGSPANSRPALSVTYLPPSPSHRDAWIAEHFDPPGEIDNFADLDGDGLNLLLEYAGDLDPIVPDGFGELFSHEIAEIDGEQCLLVRFRRDPRADDLIYRLEAGDDLVGWTVIAESVNCEPPDEQDVISDHPVVSHPPLREVTVKIPITDEAAGDRYVRLSVELN